MTRHIQTLEGRMIEHCTGMEHNKLPSWLRMGLKILLVFFLFLVNSVVLRSISLAEELHAMVPQICKVHRQITNAFNEAELRLEGTLQEINFNSTLHPRMTDFAAPYDWITRSRTDWTSGFFSGCLWMMYDRTRDPYWLNHARNWTADLESLKNDTTTHDIGFQIMSSFGNGYRLTKDPTYKEVILQAADSLATRYNETVGCIRSWSWGDWDDGNRFTVIMDNMMNLELLFWAAANGGDPAYYDMALSHALRTRQEHLRPDGSSYHVVVFNEDNGDVIEKVTHQGCHNESTWSRGQSWGIYGFTMCYRYTRDPRLLQTAQQMADYMIDHLPDDFVPPTDYDCTDGYKDSSAAAIACAALIELDRYAKSAKYGRAARNILSSLTGTEYLTDGTALSSILKRGSQLYGESERGLIYGDYYFLEAMLRIPAIWKPSNLHIIP